MPRCEVTTMKVNGLVGDCAPLGYFDPLGFSKNASPETMKKCAAPPQAARCQQRRRTHAYTRWTATRAGLAARRTRSGLAY